VVSIDADSLVVAGSLKCCVKVDETPIVSILPQVHDAWTLVGNNWLRATYGRWRTELVQLTGLTPELAQLVADLEGDVAERTVAPLCLPKVTLVCAPGGEICWHAPCGLVLDGKLEARALVIQLVMFVQGHSSHVPVILEPETGSTRPLTLCLVRFQRHSLAAWAESSPYYVATLTQLGYSVGIADENLDSVEKIWQSQPTEDGSASTLTLPGETPDLVVDVANRRHSSREKCPLCNHTHSGMCSERFSVGTAGDEVHFIPRKSHTRLARPHIVVYKSGVLGWNRFDPKFN
jgi:hypothetical protein